MRGRFLPAALPYLPLQHTPLANIRASPVVAAHGRAPLIIITASALQSGMPFGSASWRPVTVEDDPTHAYVVERKGRRYGDRCRREHAHQPGHWHLLFLPAIPASAPETAIAGNEAVDTATRAALDAGQASGLADLGPTVPKGKLIGAIFEAASQGDRLAVALLSPQARHIGGAVAALLSLFDYDCFAPW